MTITVLNPDGSTSTLTDEEFAATMADLSPAEVFDIGVSTLTATTDSLLGDREYAWSGIPFRMNSDSMSRLGRETSANVRSQLGEEPWNINVDVAGDPVNVTFTGSIAGTVLTVGALTEARSGVPGRVGIGTKITGAGVTAGTRIVGRTTGIGEAGGYLVAPSQTVGSVTMTAFDWFIDIFVSGDGVARVFRKADGSFYAFNSGNQIGMRDGVDDKEQAVMSTASDFYDELVTAAATGSDDAKKAALVDVISDIETPANWPNLTL